MLFNRSKVIRRLLHSRIGYQCSTNNKDQKVAYDALRTELMENPEFDKAFPHLRKFKNPTEYKKKPQNMDFIDTLLYEYRANELKYDQDNQIEQSRRMEGYYSPMGPVKEISQEQKEVIDVIAEKRLQELEDLDLTREEILMQYSNLDADASHVYKDIDNKQKWYVKGRDKNKEIRVGLKLRDDPFFQFVKENREARVVYMKEGEEYSVRKIVDLALRQDIGIDKSQSNLKGKYVSQDEFNSKYRTNLRMLDVYVDVKDGSEYYGVNNKPTIEKYRRMYDKTKEFFMRPMRKGELKRLNKRYLNTYDIDWRNTELLTEFMYGNGQIKNKWSTKLNTRQQKSIGRHIRTARDMLLLPHVGSIKPIHRKSLKTIEEEVADHNKQIVNIETGHIYYRSQRDIDEIKRENEKLKEFSEVRNQQYIGTEEYKQSVDKVRELLDIELSKVGVITKVDQQKCIEAVMYARYLKEQELINKGENIQELKSQMDVEINKSSDLESTKLKRDERKIYQQDEEQRKKWQQQYQEVVEVLEAKSIVGQILDIYVDEKNYDFAKIQKLQSKVDDKNADYGNPQLELKQLREELGI